MRSVKIGKKEFLVTFGSVFFLLVVSYLVFNYFSLQKKEVIDCSRKTSCVRREIKYRNINCKPWYTGDNFEELDCKKTNEGVEETALLADPANYIPGVFTKSDYKIEVISSDLEEPWDAEFLPDGNLLVSERRGRLLLVRGSKTTELLEIDTPQTTQTGLLGVAVDPDFDLNNQIYLFYTLRVTDKGEKPGLSKVLNRISKYKLVGDTLSEEEVLLDEIPGSGWHSGGRLEFGPDKNIYATTGDANSPKLAQETESLAGKILRLNRDGSIPQNNPFEDSYVYSSGHRNPQGLAWDLTRGTLYSSEHGDWRHDEINKIAPGRNYGWGYYSCKKEDIRINRKSEGILEFPLYCVKDWSMAPSGMEFVSDRESSWYGSLFIASLRGKHISRLVFNENGEVEKREIFFVSQFANKGEEKEVISERLRDVEYRNGSLYVLGDSFGLVKLTPRDGS